MQTKLRASMVLLAAVAATPVFAVPGSAVNDAGFTGPGREFIVSTSGATALGAFTRANNGSTLVDGAQNRAPLALGQSNLRIGRTTYNRADSGFRLGIADITNPSAIFPSSLEFANASPVEPLLSNDRIIYQYRESGSINGLNDLVNSNGLRLTPFELPSPAVPTANQPLWVNGNRFGAPLGTVRGYNYSAQPAVKVAFSDVRFEQGFSVPGTPSVTSAPTAAGYGLGRGNVGTSNYQQLVSANVVNGGTGSSTTFLKNNSLAVVPFNLVANPGTGLARVSKEEGGFLQAAGRLPNGLNLGASVRDVGSGTRNQGALNLGVDPSFGAGDRDRISWAPTYNAIDTTTGNRVFNQVIAELAPTALDPVGFTSVRDPNGNRAVIVRGVSELDPERSIRTGSTIVDLNERRISPLNRFADKTGGGILREVVVQSRLGVGILSAGDSRNSAGTAFTLNTPAPLRALAIDFNNGDGFNQARTTNVTEGRYDLWSAAQAINVSGTLQTRAPGIDGIYGNGDDVITNGSLVTTATNANGTYFNDEDDESFTGSPSSPIGQRGIANKFIRNIVTSVAEDTATAPTVRTPADAILQAGFILPQIMNVEKSFDGFADSLRNGGNGRSTVDPDGVGPALSEQALYTAVINNNVGNVVSNNNWVDPSEQVGGISLNGGAVRYNLYHPSNTSISADANADISISVNRRTVLAGDLNSDGVRDLGDVAKLALAFANPAAFASADTGGAVDRDGNVIDGDTVASGIQPVTVNSTVSVARAMGGLLGAAPSATTAGLITLTDFNANGNVPVAATSTPSTFTYTPSGGTPVTVTEKAVPTTWSNSVVAVEKADVIYFLRGLSVDTSAYNVATNVTQNGAVKSLTAIENRRENGVRLGQLKKNQAFIDYDSALAALLSSSTITQAEFDAANLVDTTGRSLRFDVDNNGSVVRDDARIVDRNVGKNYTVLTDVLSTFDDLIGAEFNDDNVITHVDPDGAGPGKSDFQLIRAALGSSLQDGDYNFTGGVDFQDLLILAVTFNTSVLRWSQGDSTFDGLANFNDLVQLGVNYNQSALFLPGIGQLGNGFASDWALAIGAVPEPTTLAALVGVAAVGLRRRRRA